MSLNFGKIGITECLLLIQCHLFLIKVSFRVKISELCQNITLKSDGNREFFLPLFVTKQHRKMTNRNILFLVSLLNCYEIYFLLISLRE